MHGRLAGFVVLAVTLLAGCGPASATGDSSAASSGPVPSGAASSPVTSGSAAGPALSAVRPCSVLGGAAIRQHDLTDQEASSGSGARSCTWSNDVFDEGVGYSLGVDLRDSQGLADINTDGYTVTDDPVGHHQGKQAQQTGGLGCFVSIGVSPTSRVDVVAESATTSAQMCMLANQFAKLIEPKLP